jgi:glycosyltransferase involved in cell wall biosynthesis
LPFADIYFHRFQAEKPLIEEPPNPDLFLSVVIPCHNEPELIHSLESLKKCTLPEKPVEVIVVINASERSSKDVIGQNEHTYRDALEFAKLNRSERFKVHILKFDQLPDKFAGVGLARKIGMDEALHRFNTLNTPSGLMVGFDADSTVAPNYFTELDRLFRSKPKTNACSIRFEHPVTGRDHPSEIYRNIIEYELHLRYFVAALRYAQFPFAYHTIGSAFAVRADIYAAQGGMNKKKAGEDFYFLQKIIPLGNYEELNTTCVSPSPRISDRVPFGTGAAVKKMMETGSEEYFTYSLETFEIIKEFIVSIPEFYSSAQTIRFHPSLEEFLRTNLFKDALLEIKNNSCDRSSFRNRFFLWFNAFRVMKFLNFAHENNFQRQPVRGESLKLLKCMENYVPHTADSKKLLLLYRQIQIKDLM